MRIGKRRTSCFLQFFWNLPWYIFSYIPEQNSATYCISEPYFSAFVMTFLQLGRSSLDCALDQPPHHASIASPVQCPSVIVTIVGSISVIIIISAGILTKWPIASPVYLPSSLSELSTQTRKPGEDLGPKDNSNRIGWGVMQWIGSGDPDELAVVAAMRYNTIQRIRWLMN